MVLKFAALPSATVAVFAAAIALSAATPVSALTAQECSAKYNAAKAAGTLGDVKWNEFRKAQCGDLAAPAANTLPASAAKVVFPKAVDAKYASLKPGAARRKTCSDQYKANKASNANGGMKWIQKGGGYYSACNKALKA